MFSLVTNGHVDLAVITYSSIGHVALFVPYKVLANLVKVWMG